ncbi:hypothetical protein WKI68_38245 [Streptomyces sp. MS1.HAVA.3]|uniref:PASTA domain-containing protein n=1 Tax=Streptomyces caledonius TaxID=3134107 RepID=A0ABU8UC76_9ACTN
MRTHHAIALLAAAGLLALTGCAPMTSTPEPDDKIVTPASAAPSAPAATPRTTPPPVAATSAAATVAVPDFVGQVLQTAQDGAQAQGFYLLTSHDSLGKNRNQVLDRNWKVCTQTPAAGTKAGTDTKLDFGTVKLEETCP